MFVNSSRRFLADLAPLKKLFHPLYLVHFRLLIDGLLPECHLLQPHVFHLRLWHEHEVPILIILIVSDVRIDIKLLRITKHRRDCHLVVVVEQFLLLLRHHELRVFNIKVRGWLCVDRDCRGETRYHWLGDLLLWDWLLQIELLLNWLCELVLVILWLQSTADLINVELFWFLWGLWLYGLKVLRYIPIKCLNTLLSFDGFYTLLLIQTLLRLVPLENLI